MRVQIAANIEYSDWMGRNQMSSAYPLMKYLEVKRQ